MRFIASEAPSRKKMPQIFHLNILHQTWASANLHLPIVYLNKWWKITSPKSEAFWKSHNAKLITAVTILIIILWPNVSKKIPGPLIAILITTAAVQLLHLPVETIRSRFGIISSSFPKPEIPIVDFATIKHLIQPAFTIALLCAIESLLSAVVADGMIGGKPPIEYWISSARNR